MLILTHRTGEVLRIGADVWVTVLGVKGNQIRLGINAPKSIAVHREEIFERIAQENHPLADSPVATPPTTKVVRVESKRARRPTGT